MTTLAESRERVDCTLPVKVAKRDDFDARFLEESQQGTSRIFLQSRR